MTKFACVFIQTFNNEISYLKHVQGQFIHFLFTKNGNKPQNLSNGEFCKFQTKFALFNNKTQGIHHNGNFNCKFHLFNNFKENS
jgi:hypothetical protein